MCAEFFGGGDRNVIRQITDAIESVDGVSLLDVDPGASTNRTVVTFVGYPDAAVEAAFRGIRKAAELIDMRKQKGAHPRIGGLCLPLHSGEQRERRRSDRMCKSAGQARRRGIENPGVSVAKERPEISPE